MIWGENPPFSETPIWSYEDVMGPLFLHGRKSMARGYFTRLSGVTWAPIPISWKSWEPPFFVVWFRSFTIFQVHRSGSRWLNPQVRWMRIRAHDKPRLMGVAIAIELSIIRKKTQWF